MKEKFIKLMNSYNAIIICLMVLVAILLTFSYTTLRKTKIFMFSGSGDSFEIYDGVISLNHDINLFEGSNITSLLKKDVHVSKYKIGYYVKVGENLKELITISDEDKEGFSLRAVLEGISAFNATELPQSDRIFTDDKIRNIEKGLYFVIEATTLKGDVINESTELSVTRITKY